MTVDSSRQTEPPLAGITILDLSRVLSGPYCTMLAADMGARVIKIEHPGTGDDTRAWGPPFQHGESAYYLSVNRGKESVAIDFKTPEGRDLVLALAARADAVVENFRPGTLDRADLGYGALSARDPRLIYVSISGFGQSGPRRNEPGYDAVAQAEGGLMSITGESHGAPVRVGVAVGDIAAGMFAFQGLLLALIARARTGRGQLVDVSLLDSVAALLTYQASRYFATGEAPQRTGNRHGTIAPYDTYSCADGVVVLAVGNDVQWRRLCEVLSARDSGARTLGADARYTTNASRVEHYAELNDALGRIFVGQRRAPLIDSLRAAGVPCGAVRSIAEALADPQLAARDMIASLAHPAIGALQTLGVPTRLSETPGRLTSAPPRLGEHSRSVLAHDLRFPHDEIDRLVASRIVGDR